MEHFIELRDLGKSYGSNKVLENFNLNIQKGDLVALLGPSGCGKTTALRLIAGLIAPDAGQILVGGSDITHAPANKRNTTMVFQSYALFPHMTVAENIGFGLKMHKVPKAEMQEKIEQMIGITQLDELAARYPKQLSGGQQQRVALARALVMNPDVLLLDEPLSNLDAKLRHEMRVEIRLLHERLGLTTVFVTHDQDEALTLADRIVVLNGGRIVQNDTPDGVFEHPVDFFVADFTAVRNFFRGSFTGGNTFTSDKGLSIVCGEADYAKKLIGVRPAKIIVNPASADGYANAYDAVVRFTTYRGTVVEMIADIGDTEVIVEVPAASYDASAMARGETVRLVWRAQDVLLLQE